MEDYSMPAKDRRGKGPATRKAKARRAARAAGELEAKRRRFERRPRESGFAQHTLDSLLRSGGRR